MSYQKILVDNVTCMRRFHITFDSEAKPVAHTKVVCPHCQKEVLSKDHHPPLEMVRDENLIQTIDLSSLRMKGCDFKDSFPPINLSSG